MSSTEDLITWLRTQLDNDEAMLGDPGGYCDGGVHLTDERWQADIKAKRRILDEFSWEGGETRAIIYLAQPYAGQPGWQEEWAA